MKMHILLLRYTRVEVLIFIMTLEENDEPLHQTIKLQYFGILFATEPYLISTTCFWEQMPNIPTGLTLNTKGHLPPVSANRALLMSSNSK